MVLKLEGETPEGGLLPYFLLKAVTSHRHLHSNAFVILPCDQVEYKVPCVDWPGCRLYKSNFASLFLSLVSQGLGQPGDFSLVARFFLIQVSVGWTTLSGCMKKLKHLRVRVPVGLWFRLVEPFPFKRVLLISVYFFQLKYTGMHCIANLSSLLTCK